MDKMVAVLIVGPVIGMAIAGCSDAKSSMDQPKTVSVVPPAERFVGHDLSPRTVSVARPAKQIVSHKTSVRAEALKSANESEETPLMKCMSKACKAECSPNVAKESRPKWCAYFTEPI
jgi:hypothetical protein